MQERRLNSSEKIEVKWSVVQNMGIKLQFHKRQIHVHYSEYQKVQENAPGRGGWVVRWNYSTYFI
jgi:hypothetical protein